MGFDGAGIQRYDLLNSDWLSPWDQSSNVIGGDGITAAADEITVDATVVRTSGTQTIAGAKTFSDNIIFKNDKGLMLRNNLWN